MKIEGEGQLSALHKALIEAKFHPDPHHPEIAWSPIVAEIANRVQAALLEEGEGLLKNLRKKRWEEGRFLDLEHPYVKVAALRIREVEQWQDLPEDEKKKRIAILLSPFRANPEAEAKLIEIKNTDGGDVSSRNNFIF